MTSLTHYLHSSSPSLLTNHWSPLSLVSLLDLCVQLVRVFSGIKVSVSPLTNTHLTNMSFNTRHEMPRRHNNVYRKVSEKLHSKGFQVFSEQSIPSPGLETNISRPDLIVKRSVVTNPWRKLSSRSIKSKKVEFHGLATGSRGASGIVLDSLVPN